MRTNAGFLFTALLTFAYTWYLVVTGNPVVLGIAGVFVLIPLAVFRWWIGWERTETATRVAELITLFDTLVHVFAGFLAGWFAASVPLAGAVAFVCLAAFTAAQFVTERKLNGQAR